ncbi:hypothetical protein [Chlamydiifrater phoenicopteri]|uniref:hypothetical protein n=1 Tax=Chlamydiifrater phoenicopteri TaxID=2681469 RepID=UPI001BCB1A0D|nr:hypothetical protein [Chlamydiifrater phoenicopteri]
MSTDISPSVCPEQSYLEKTEDLGLINSQKTLNLLRRLSLCGVGFSFLALTFGIGGVVNALLSNIIVGPSLVVFVVVFSALLLISIFGMIFVDEQFVEFLTREEEVVVKEEPEEKLILLEEKKTEELPEEFQEEVLSECPYVKKGVWNILEDFEKLYYQSPLACAEVIAGESVSWASFVQEEFLGQSRVEGAVSRRSQRELAFVFLGFLTWDELKGISNLWEAAEAKGTYDLDELYAKCIKKYPRIIAAEGAYFSWIGSSFPYLGNARSAIFQDAFKYKMSFFLRLSYFVKSCPEESKKFVPLTRCLSGLAPACLASLELGHVSASDICKLRREKLWSWEFFCQKVSEFCRESVFYENTFGNWESFLKFVEEGSEVFSSEKKFAFDYQREEENFFSTPLSLWDLFTICEEDGDLLDKIDEGLMALQEFGYLGNMTVGEIQNLELIILGLK